MSDFLNGLQSYLFNYKNMEQFDCENSFNFNLKNFIRYADEVNYIKFSVLSIFDGKKSIPYNGACENSYDGIITEKEFNSVCKDDYNKYIEDIKNSYKAETGRELKYHIPSYQELKNMLKNDSPYEEDSDRNKIQTKEIIEPIKPNGKIGQSNQAYSGECYQNASNFALSYTKKGQKLLANSISIGKDKHKVTFHGAQPKPVTYEISQQELTDAQEEYINVNGQKQKKYSYGDADIILIDLAVERYRKSINYKLRNCDTKEVKGFDDYLSGGCISRHLSLITGKLGYLGNYIDFNNQLSNSTKLKSFDNETLEKKKNKVVPLLNFLCKLGNENIAAGCSFRCVDGNWGVFGQKYDMHEKHSYAIKEINIDNKTITICNPWLGKDADKIVPFEDFIKYVETIHYIKL